MVRRQDSGLQKEVSSRTWVALGHENHLVQEPGTGPEKGRGDWEGVSTSLSVYS